MKKEKLLDAIGNIDDEIFLEFAQVHPKSSVRFIPKYKSLVAACIALFVAVIGVFNFSAVVEAQEYEKAVSFFEEYDLDIENLSRDDIIKVYKDIFTGTFTDEKTFELIAKNISGYEVTEQIPNPKDLENLWNLTNSNSDFYFIGDTEKNIRIDYDENLIEKYENNVLIWSKKIAGEYISNVFSNEKNSIITGSTGNGSDIDYVIFIDNTNGEMLWETKLNDEYIAKVIFAKDEIIVFSRKNYKSLVFSKYDMNGNLTYTKETEIGNKGIWNAVELGEGYLVEVGNQSQNIEEILKLNAKGEIENTFTYSSENSEYYIEDMIEYNGKIFLSANEVPAYQGKNVIHRDIDNVLNEIFEAENLHISNEELTKLVRENYTATLLICDQETGVPQEFFSVSASLGAKLKTENGNLIWETHSITDTFLSLATSSFSVGGACTIYNYVFSEQYKLLEVEKTDKLVDFRK